MIINLETGELEEDAESVMPEPTQTMAQVIDLETGALIEDEPRRLLGAPAARMQEQAAQVEEGRETRATKELEELGAGGLLADESFASVAKIAPVLALTADPREIGNILTSNFPHIGIIEDEKGNLIAANNKTGVQVVINKPGMSGLDFIQGISTAAAFTPGAQAASIPIAAGKRALTGATTAGATQTGIEALQKEMGGEFDLDEIAIATGLGGTAELVLPVIQSLRQSKLQRQAESAGQQIEDVSKQISTAEEAAEATGVPLFPAQKTTIPTQLEQQSFIPQLPAGTAKAHRELGKQNKAVVNAVDEFLNTIAPDESIITGAEKFRTASVAAIERQRLIRKNLASPLYRDAFEVGSDVDLKPVTDAIEVIITDYPESGEVFKSAMRVKRLIGDDPSLRKLHNAKLEIDQMINKVGESSLGNTTKKELVDLQNKLVAQMDESSDLYKSARETFAANSPPVDALQKSIIGKLSEVDDTQLKTISKKLFDPAETNPQVIRKAKKVIQDIDPDAWNQIFRSEIERRLGSVKSTLEDGTIENIPAQMFNAIFGNTKQRAILYNSVDGEMKRNLKYLETALSRARLGRATGSQTAGREEMKRELRGGFSQALRDFVGKPVAGLASLGATTITGKTADAAFDARVKALANVLFDPQWKPKMKELRQLDSRSPAASRALAQLLDDALAVDIRNTKDALEETPQEIGQQ